MILVDTAPLVALCDERDQHHARAMRDLRRLPQGGFVTCTAVLAEACYHLTSGYARSRLVGVLKSLGVAPLDGESEPEAWEYVFEWLGQYAEHRPDLADAVIVALSHQRRRMSVWTYDGEFSTIWRRLDGTRIPLAVKLG